MLLIETSSQCEECNLLEICIFPSTDEGETYQGDDATESPDPTQAAALLYVETSRQLKEELDKMAMTRAGLIQGFAEYLEPLNAAVDEVKARLNAGDVPATIARKLQFEIQISPSLYRSKELLSQISAGLGKVQAA